MLPFYAHRFQAVEINNSFYQLPRKKTLTMWSKAVPERFMFAVKGSRYITHMKKLKDGDETTPPLMDAVNALGTKLGPILFQLPPRWKINTKRLRDFLQVLPGRVRYAFEFRDPSWFDESTYQALRDHNAAFCIYHLAGRLAPKEVTADFIYVRLHGPQGAYEGQYDTQTLAGWAGAFDAWQRQGKQIFCFFDNDQAGYAARDALRLQKMVQGR
jgi:uncharacterized protein YecE (DUF72 family)